jgi:hypothetical protein
MNDVWLSEQALKKLLADDTMSLPPCVADA